jgi:hypothetical protein
MVRYWAPLNNRSFTEEEILSEFYPWWKERMISKYGDGCPLINEQNCLEDWMTVNYGYRIEGST